MSSRRFPDNTELTLIGKSGCRLSLDPLKAPEYVTTMKLYCNIF